MVNMGMAQPPSEANSSPGPTRSRDGSKAEQFGKAELNESLTNVSILRPAAAPAAAAAAGWSTRSRESIVVK